MRVAFGLVLAALTSGGDAYSQVRSPIVSSDEPIYVQSRAGELLRNECRGVYLGDVIATQGKSRLTTDKLTLLGSQPAGPAGDCETDRFIAEANVLYTTPELRIRADRAVYDQTAEIITFTGKVSLRNANGSVMQGTVLVYSIADGKASITAGAGPIETTIQPSKRDAPN